MDGGAKRTTSGHTTNYVPQKKSKPGEMHSTSIIFSVKSQVGALNKALNIFKDCDIDLEHIESRPSKTSSDRYEFFVSAKDTAEKVAAVVKRLEEEMECQATLLDTHPDTSNPKWFPRTISDLDMFVHRVLDAGAELQSDHPGFTDPEYRERRAYFADLALKYRHGEKIPHIEYTKTERDTWSQVFTKLQALYPTHACAEFNRVFPLLIENCGYRADNVPQLEDISKFLHSCTGFRLRPVAGLLSSRDFLAGLAFRVFHSTQYLRHHTKPLYTPEPDICHEILGHVPLFADKAFAEFSQEIGLASLGASDEDIEKLATVYWFTVEFGVCHQNGELKAYGAGLLSSFGELEYCLSDKPEIRPFNPAVTGVQKYPITEYQPVYFAAESFASAKEKVREFAASLDKPFTARYNPYTESIELLDNVEQLRNLTVSIQSDVSLLVAALGKRV